MGLKVQVVTMSISLAALIAPFSFAMPISSSAVTTTTFPFQIFLLISAIVFAIVILNPWEVAP